jgi:ferritin-like metal-binding protein YciE
MDDLFVHTLRDIYYAEKQIVQSLPEMIHKSSDPQLKQVFQAHLGETKNHVTRLEQVFKLHGEQRSPSLRKRAAIGSQEIRTAAVAFSPSPS